MKKIAIILSCFICEIANAQMGNDPTQWEFSTKKIDNKTYELHIMAYIQYPWHIYAQDMNDGLGQPTNITFTKNPLVEFIGKPKEVGQAVKKKIDDITIKYYNNEVEFIQIVKLKSAVKTNITGNIDYQTCTEMSCLSPTSRRFRFSLN